MSTFYKDDYTLPKNQNHTTKISGVWFTTWITVWNHIYISLEFTVKNNPFWASCSTAQVLWCGPSAMQDPFLKVDGGYSKARQNWAVLSFGGEGESVARWATSPQISSWWGISVVIFVRIQSIVEGFNYIPLACQFTPGGRDALSG